MEIKEVIQKAYEICKHKEITRRQLQMNNHVLRMLRRCLVNECVVVHEEEIGHTKRSIYLKYFYKTNVCIDKIQIHRDDRGDFNMIIIHNGTKTTKHSLSKADLSKELKVIKSNCHSYFLELYLLYCQT